MTKQEIIEKYTNRIKTLRGYIETQEKTMKLYERKKDDSIFDLKSYYINDRYYMELIIECNTCFEIIEDLKKL